MPGLSCASVCVSSLHQGWPTVDTCPPCGLTCQLWSTTTSSLQTDPARRPEASAKRCGASTRKTARWVQSREVCALCNTVAQQHRTLNIWSWSTSVSKQQELQQHNKSLNHLPAPPDTPAPPPLHLHATEFNSHQSQQLAKSSVSHCYRPTTQSTPQKLIRVIFNCVGGLPVL